MIAAIQTFFAMGGYGLYVWSAYGLTALVLIGGLCLARRREYRLLRQLDQHRQNKAAQ